MDLERPFRMPFYPLPVILASGGWLYILYESGWAYIGGGMAIVLLGICVFLIRANQLREWPFEGKRLRL